MNIAARAKAIVLSPKPTWEVINAEPASAASLYTGYLMVVAAIPAVCGFIGLSLVGMGGFGMTLRLPLLAGFVSMLLSYLLSLVGVYLLSLVINALAPRFGGVANPVQALKVAVYASTAALLGGVFSLLPILSVLGLLAGLYSLYLLHTGLPILMKSSRGQSLAYTAVVVAAALVLGFALGSLASWFALPGAGLLASGGEAAVRIATPQGGAVDSPAIAAAQRSIETAARQMDAASARNDSASTSAAARDAGTAAAALLGGAEAVPASVLQALLPEQLGGLARTGLESQNGSMLGVAASQVSADYGSGERTVHLEISDLGGLGAMAAVAFGMVQGEKEDAEHAEKTWQDNNRSLHESYQKDGSSAEYKVALKNGILVSLSASGTDIASLRGMATHIDLSALERLARPTPQ